MAEGLRIACIGEAMVELNIDRRPEQIGFAGDTLNTAVYLARALGPGHEVGFVSVLGRDVLSDRMTAFIAAEGVATRGIARHPQRLPGIYAIAVDEKGERSFSYWRDQSAARTLFEHGFAALDGCDLLYLSGITLAILPPPVRAALLDRLAQGPGRVVFDSNYRPRLWESVEAARAAIGAALRLAWAALPSVDDEMALFGDADAAAVLARLRGWGVTRGALKRGAAGALPLDPLVIAPDFPAAAQVVDTTAAGDSFNGAWLGAVLTGTPEAEALARAHAQALEVIARPGAITPRQGT